MFSTYLRQLRTDRGLVLREVALRSGIDQGLISKYERGKRRLPESHLAPLATAYEVGQSEMRAVWLSERIADIVRYEDHPEEILMAAEERINYLKSQAVMDLPVLKPAIEKRLERIDHLQKEWADRRPKGGVTLKKLNEYVQTKYTFESNRIEGNTLTLAETHLVINEGLTIGGRSINEHLEALNHKRAIGYIDSLLEGKVTIDRRTVMDIHRLILKGIDDEHAGKLRGVPVRISGSAHEPPQPYLLEKMMEDFYGFFKARSHKMHPVILAAEAHERLVSIHPFIDGNGRTSRLLMNLILLDNGYPIANLRGDKRSRLKYYKALEAVQMKGDTAPFYSLVTTEVERSLKMHLEMC